MFLMKMFKIDFLGFNQFISSCNVKKLALGSEGVRSKRAFFAFRPLSDQKDLSDINRLPIHLTYKILFK